MKSMVFCFLLLLSSALLAQDYKGKLFIETGVKASGGGGFNNFTGKTGFSFNKLHWKTYNNDGTVWQEDSYNSFSWAIAPRLGYYLSNSLNTGIDIQYFQNILSLGNNYRNFTTGLFFRFYFLDKKIKPFVELSSGLGLSKNEVDRISPGGGEFQTVEKLNLFYYSGSAGLTFVLSDNLNLNLSLRIQDTIENEKKDKEEGSVSYITQKTHNLEINPMLSISYLFGKIQKNQ
jgi:hypothetical protein